MSRTLQCSVLGLFQFHRFSHFHHAGTAVTFGYHVVTSGTERDCEASGVVAPDSRFPVQRSMSNTDTDAVKTGESTESNSGDTTGERRLVADGGVDVYLDDRHETVTVAGHETRAGVCGPHGSEVKYECVNCGRTSNSVTLFDQTECDGELVTDGWREP